MRIAKEGKVKFQVYEGEVNKQLPVFYNPEMEEHRNITVSVLNSYFPKKFLACDPLAGSGVRGLRIVKETKGEVVLNDITSEAVKLMKSNFKLNKINQKKYKVFHKDAKILLLENWHNFDFVDIDPFGSPAKFFEPSAVAIKPDGLFAATATDTGALAGSFKEACLRRYGVRVCRTDFYKELGIRALITAIQQSFAKYDLAFEPLLPFSNHFFRVFGKVGRGKQKADKILEQTGFVSYCQRCLNREFFGVLDKQFGNKIKSQDSPRTNCTNCQSKNQIIGPIWLGKIQVNKFVKKVNNEQKKRGFKKVFIEEIEHPFYFDVHRVCGLVGKESPKFEKIIENLKKSGFEASRSNLFPDGIKTNADFKVFFKCI